MELGRIVEGAEHIDGRRGLQDRFLCGNSIPGDEGDDQGRTAEGEDVVGGKPGAVAHRQNGHCVGVGRSAIRGDRTRRLVDGWRILQELRARS